MQKKPIAIVGAGGVFPRARGVAELWQNILDRIDAVQTVPADRWIAPADMMVRSEPMPDKAYANRACLIEDVAFKPFDTATSAEWIQSLDPLYHLTLQAGWDAFQDAQTASLNKKRIGVVMAAIVLPTDAASLVARKTLLNAFEEKLFGELSPDVPPIDWKQALAARVAGLPAALLAKTLGLGGGSYTLDAACASSLYAVKLACDELHANRVDAMLAGGVSRPDCLYTQVGFSQLRALSPSGRCAPFDHRADGLVVGEGAGVVVLKRLADAVAHGDKIYGIITGIGLSNDIQGNLLAPDISGQLRAMKQAYQNAGIRPWDVDLIECHGTGTPVGDKTELNSLQALWGESGWTRRQCAIGSVKSMIGHLLTAAGAASLIKTIMALKHRTLPPSLNFERPHRGSPLEKGPFRVQTAPAPWQRRASGAPRRGAVSAFGFGGINAHVVLEDYPETPWQTPKRIAGSDAIRLRETSGAVSVEEKPAQNVCFDTVCEKGSDAPCEPPPAVAIVGMAAAFGRQKSLQAFQEMIFRGETLFEQRPSGRWRGCENAVRRHLGRDLPMGGYMEKIDWTHGAFRIPPSEVPEILPQQLLMLQVAADAMRDAGLAVGGERPRMGVVVGIDFDYEATDFHLRWSMAGRVKEWAERLNLDLSPAELDAWLAALQDSVSPPLTRARTLGALGGIVASRIAREFRFGGSSFGVSAEAASGLRAVEIGLRALQQNELDAVLVGAVDLAGDARSVATADCQHRFKPAPPVYALAAADGCLPSEGAAAIVLQRRADAGNQRIYAVVKGIGAAGGGGMDDEPSLNAYLKSLERACHGAGVPPESIGYYEAHGSAEASLDRIEALALQRFFPGTKGEDPPWMALGSVKANIGHAGAAAGMAGLIKSSLCLYHEILPPLPDYRHPVDFPTRQTGFHVPVAPQYWLRDRGSGPRRACTAAVTADGNCMHVILEAAEGRKGRYQHPRNKSEASGPSFPLGPPQQGLWILEGNTPADLLERLDELQAFSMDHTGHPLFESARRWYHQHPLQPGAKSAVAVFADSLSSLNAAVQEARRAVKSGSEAPGSRPGGVCYTSRPLGREGQLAFVYPGSGNHYVGMGREIGVLFPEILRDMDGRAERLKTQMIPSCWIPQRIDWSEGWESEVLQKIAREPMTAIFGQVVYGTLATRLLQRFGLSPRAVIGYSLGESAGLFAMKAWPDREAMMDRLFQSDVFRSQLAGPCRAARRAWRIPADLPFEWRAAAVRCSATEAAAHLKRWPYLRLLIVNTPDECVIGGHAADLAAAVEQIGCDAFSLDGVVSVHCDAVQPVASDYRSLHLFPVQNVEGVRFYSCYQAAAYPLSSEAAADSILQQALYGFNFPDLIRCAHRDGVRIFVEIGPGGSCTRMIDSILADAPHAALAGLPRHENTLQSVCRTLGTLAAHRVPLTLDALFGEKARDRSVAVDVSADPSTTAIFLGGPAPAPERPLQHATSKAAHFDPETEKQHGPTRNSAAPAQSGSTNRDRTRPPADAYRTSALGTDLLQEFAAGVEATARTHQQFLAFSDELGTAYADALGFHSRLFQHAAADPLQHGLKPGVPAGIKLSAPADSASGRPPAFDRDMCMEFAVGSVVKVLGPEFAEVDTYPVRVRLPDEPLMLVDRILSVTGEKASLGSGRVVTEHDVLPDAWYLDGGRAPVCISVEAGQADLFLCSYLGIDLAVQGRRAYRLLDATVVFHRGLPRPGETIRYRITIERFARQGQTYLFFFNFEGTIGQEPLITMTHGCAGFFTEAEIERSGGILERAAAAPKAPRDAAPSAWRPPVAMRTESYDASRISALRRGDLAGCFGTGFAGLSLIESLRLPGGRMQLIDRVLTVDPGGGVYGQGTIRAEADIHTDDWFLTCHFMDDPVMPGTLMYECCAHTLRVFLLRLGWITDRPAACWEPVQGVKAVLKCRGPVTPKTRKVVYAIDIKDIGFRPEPYAVADALMYADGRCIVRFDNLSLQITGTVREDIEHVWQKNAAAGRRPTAAAENTAHPSGTPPACSTGPLYDRASILAFAEGNPSAAFGEPYRMFDRERTIARLPRPPYSFVDRIVEAAPRPWELVPDGWIEAQFDVRPDDWYFAANRIPCMPFCILLEIALQPCGWLAAYAGSALHSQNDLKFRNLGGRACLHRDIQPVFQTLRMRSRMTQVSAAADMIIEHFEFEVLQENTPVYSGTTYFGFFTEATLAQQVGLRNTADSVYRPPASAVRDAVPHPLAELPPLAPGDPAEAPRTALAMPAKALGMIDRIDLYLPEGGPHGLGFVRGVKSVNPEEWFFRAHFYQDPVWPGSLGIEAFLQLIKFIARQRWPDWIHRRCFAHLKNVEHTWIYRGQVIPAHQRVEVEAVVTRVHDGPVPEIRADGLLRVDGLDIYKMEHFGLELISP